MRWASHADVLNRPVVSFNLVTADSCLQIDQAAFASVSAVQSWILFQNAKRFATFCQSDSSSSHLILFNSTTMNKYVCFLQLIEFAHNHPKHCIMRFPLHNIIGNRFCKYLLGMRVYYKYHLY